MSNQTLDQEITQYIIDNINDNNVPWRKPYEATHVTVITPMRHNHEFYRGINTILLMSAAFCRQYTSPYWLTYRQAQSISAKVRKSEKGFRVIKFGTFEPEDSKTLPSSGSTNPEKSRQRPYIKRYTVFNIEQIENLPEDYQQVRTVEKITTHEVHRFADALSIPVRHGNSHGQYIRSGNDEEHIRLPNYECYPDDDAYIATFFHELIHATGHQKRLARLESNPDDAQQSFEELVAELGSVMLCNRFGISTDTDNRHIPYIKGWLQGLKNDHRMIRKAASEAQKAIDYLMEVPGVPNSIQR
jgi:antirestriction protein ArdC